MGDIDLDRFSYPVGVLANMRRIWGNLRLGRPAVARQYLGQELGSLRRLIGKRDWHNLRQHLNGFLYEPEPWPEGARTCGHGWTRRGARRSFYRRLGRR